MSRGKLQPLEDPAKAAAMGRCWLSRTPMPKGVTVRADHPRPCEFCRMPSDLLIEQLNGFLDWSGLRPPERVDPAEPPMNPLRARVELFLAAPKGEQTRLVEEAMWPTEPGEWTHEVNLP